MAETGGWQPRRTRHARLDGGAVKLLTCTGLDWTHKSPAIAAAVAFDRQNADPSLQDHGSGPAYGDQNQRRGDYSRHTHSPAEPARRHAVRFHPDVFRRVPHGIGRRQVNHGCLRGVVRGIGHDRRRDRSEQEQPTCGGHCLRPRRLRATVARGGAYTFRGG